MSPTSPLSPASPVLVAEGVERNYGARQVLGGVSFQIMPGERLALTGPSGSGKSTLLNCIGGVDRPDAGTIRLGATRLDQIDGTQLARLRREKIGTIFQFFHLLPTLTVAENIELPLRLLQTTPAEIEARVTALLTRVGLSHQAEALPSQLSGGEQQRVAIARALVHRPALVLADEPTGNLDSASGARILELLREITDESGQALVLVTHSEEAAAICHRRLHLRDGLIVEQS